MIEFDHLSSDLPYEIFKKKYDQAIKEKQQNIEAISISSFNKEINEVDSRYVNLKFIKNDRFIFFSNYESPKAFAFSSFNQITALVYWSSINVQIRMKAKIRKTSYEYNQKYFFDRSKEKNALAISSRQSSLVDSYDQVKKNYNKSLKNDDLKRCPEYWGGYSFIPYYFEFWEGDKFRLNRRYVYEKKQDNWQHFLLQP
tara:strand:- start:471 stop:1067 length:597 start_codon:yes stop_codon:yes gene_type:complete